MTKPSWNDLLFFCAQLFVSGIMGTLMLLAVADNPWDGDELFKGPVTGWTSMGGSQGLQALWSKLNGS